MTPIINQFKEYLYQVGYGEVTRTALPVLVHEFIQQQSISDVSYVEQQQLRAFYEYLQTRPLKKRSGALSESMITHYLYALRTFFAWLEKTGQADYNPISGMKFKRPQQNVRKPLTIREAQELFEAAATLKQTAMLHIFYSCGLRRGEGEALNIHDIHFREQLLYVREGKGAKRRVVPMTAGISRELEMYYLQERCNSQVKKVKDTDAFILNKTGTRMRGEGYIKLLKQLTSKAALQQEITLHHLRHSIATHLLQSGMSMEYVRDFLGHSYLETTQIYAKPTAEQLKLLC